MTQEPIQSRKASSHKNGAPGGIRTPDQQDRNLLLYPAELQAPMEVFAGSNVTCSAALCKFSVIVLSLLIQGPCRTGQADLRCYSDCDLPLDLIPTKKGAGSVMLAKSRLYMPRSELHNAINGSFCSRQSTERSNAVLAQFPYGHFCRYNPRSDFESAVMSASGPSHRHSKAFSQASLLRQLTQVMRS